MPKDTKNDNKEKTLSLKTGTKSSKSSIGSRSRGISSCLLYTSDAADDL